MKRICVVITFILLLVVHVPLSVEAAGFVPWEGSETVGHYFLDENNLQFFYNGFAEINGIVYVFDEAGFTDITNTYDLNDPHVQTMLASNPAQIFGYWPDIESNGITVSTIPIENHSGTFQITDVRVTHSKYTSSNRTSLKFLYHGGVKEKVYCYYKGFDIDGFEVTSGVISATKEGLNTDTVCLRENIVRLELSK